MGHLKQLVPNAVVDGLVRVDVFESLNGRLVVNEFESLEARFNSASTDDELCMCILLFTIIAASTFSKGLVTTASSESLFFELASWNISSHHSRTLLTVHS